MASFWRENQLVWTKKKTFKESSWFGEPKCKLRSKVVHFFVFFFFFIVFFYPCYSNFVKMKNMPCIEDIVKSTLALSLLTNFRVDMDSSMDLHKVVARRGAFRISKCMKWSWIKRWGRKQRFEMSIFTSGRGFGFITKN